MDLRNLNMKMHLSLLCFQNPRMTRTEAVNSAALAFGVFGSALTTVFWGFSVWAGGPSVGWGWTWVSSVWPLVPTCVWLWSRLCSWTCCCNLALFFLFSFFLSCLRCIWAASFFWDSFWGLENRKRKRAVMRCVNVFFFLTVNSKMDLAVCRNKIFPRYPFLKFCWETDDQCNQSTLMYL